MLLICLCHYATVRYRKTEDNEALSTAETKNHEEESEGKEKYEDSEDGKKIDFVPVLNIDQNGVTLEEINAQSKNIKYGGNRVSLTMDTEEFLFEDVQIKGRGNATWGWKKKPYQLTFSQEMEIGHSVVELSDELGALVEVEAVREPEDIHAYSQHDNICVVLKEAVQDSHEFHRQDALDSFMEVLNRLEDAAIRGDWSAVQKEIDVDSFVRYYLNNEFSANPDAFATSFYMYRDGSSDVIHAGPVGDFDMAFANPKYTSGDASSANRSWAYADPRCLLQEQESMAVKLFQYLMDIPEFCAQVEKQYQEVVRNAIEGLPDHLYSVADRIQEAALKDQATWHETSTFLGDLNVLIQWIARRCTYMDLLYGSRVCVTDGRYQIDVSQDVEDKGDVDILTDDPEEYWVLEKQVDNSYKITGPDTGMVLSLDREDSILDREKVIWKEDSGSLGQRWILTSQKDAVVILSKLTGLTLTFDEGTGTMTVRE